MRYKQQLFHLVFQAYMNEGTIEHPRFDVWYPLEMIKDLTCKVKIGSEYYFFPYDAIKDSLRVSVIENKYFILIKFP
jgi:hypothetical protein